MRRFIVVGLILAVFAASGTVAEDRRPVPPAVLAEARKWLEASVIHQGVVMSPLFPFGLIVGRWGGGSSPSEVRLVAEDGRGMLLQRDQTTAWLGDRPVRLPVAPMYVKWRSPEEARMLVPLRAVVEALGGKVSFDRKGRKVGVTGAGGTVWFTPRGTLKQPRLMYYRIAGRLYPKGQYLVGWRLYFPLRRFEQLGGKAPDEIGAEKTINSEVCRPLEDLIHANRGRYAMEWVDEGTTDVVLWLPAIGEIR
jgi:hypothetical protein